MENSKSFEEINKKHREFAEKVLSEHSCYKLNAIKGDNQYRILMFKGDGWRKAAMDGEKEEIKQIGGPKNKSPEPPLAKCPECNQALDTKTFAQINEEFNQKRKNEPHSAWSK